MQEQVVTQQTYRDYLNGRIDEAQEIIRTKKTGDPLRPYYNAFVLECIIDCSRRILGELDEEEAKRR